MRVVNDLAGEKDAVVRKLRHGLIGILDGALHAVAEAKLHGEQEGQTARFETEAVCPHEIDDLAAIVFLELRTDFGTKAKSLLKVRLFHVRAASDCNMRDECARFRRFDAKGISLSTRRAKITAVSHYLPERRVTNKDLEKIVDTSDEWILERTGIRERHFVEKGQATSDLGAAAAKKLLEKRGIDPAEIDLIIVATVTPDMFFPSSACLVQNKIGARNAWGFDLSGACSGFLYALATGSPVHR